MTADKVEDIKPPEKTGGDEGLKMKFQGKVVAESAPSQPVSIRKVPPSREDSGKIPAAGLPPKPSSKVEIEPILSEEMKKVSGAAEEFLETLAEEKAAAGTILSGAESPPPPKAGFRIVKRALLFLPIPIVLVGIVLGVGFMISRATVEIRLVQKEETISFDAKFQKDVVQADTANLLFPLEVVKKMASASQSYPATGKAAGGTKAKGTVLIYNEFGTDPQPLVEKTRFLSTEGKLFRLTKRVVVPGAKMEGGELVPSSIAAEVVADQPGEEFNIEPTRFSIPGFQGSPRYGKFYGISQEPFTGGSSAPAKSIATEDIEQGTSDLSRATFEKLQDELKAGLPEGFRLLPEASKISVKNLSVGGKPGDVADTVTIRFDAELTALVFDEAMLREPARQKFTDENLQKSGGVAVTFTYILRQISFDKRTMTLGVGAKGTFGSKIDTLALRQELGGKGTEEVTKRLLAIPGVKEARVLFWPRWVRKMPKDISRIKVVIE